MLRSIAMSITCENYYISFKEIKWPIDKMMHNKTATSCKSSVTDNKLIIKLFVLLFRLSLSCAILISSLSWCSCIIWVYLYKTDAGVWYFLFLLFDPYPHCIALRPWYPIWGEQVKRKLYFFSFIRNNLRIIMWKGAGQVQVCVQQQSRNWFLCFSAGYMTSAWL